MHGEDDGAVAQLWEEYKLTASTEARNALINRYHSLVRRVVRQMVKSSSLQRGDRETDPDDLISYGVFGLIDAIARFEPERGFKFETYAAERIRGAIMDELRSADWVPRLERDTKRQRLAAEEALTAKLGRVPTLAETAQRVGVSVAALEAGQVRQAMMELRSSAGGIASLGLHPGPDGGVEGGLDALLRSGDDPESDVDFSLVRHRIATAIETLSERDRAVLALIYREEMSLDGAGAAFGVTKGWACHLRDQALIALRTALREGR